MAKTKMTRDPSSVKLPDIEVWDPIPQFASEEQEAEFWASHQFGESFFKAPADPDPFLPPPRPRTSPVSVRFDASTVRRLRAVAERKHKGYQTLLKEFVLERLYEEEKREGIIPS